MADQFIREGEQDAFVKGVGTPGFNNLHDLQTAGINKANEWFQDLTNKIAQQFVTSLLTIRLSMRRHHFRGEFVYGDWFEMIWGKLLNVKKYNKAAYTPSDLAKDGHKLIRENIKQDIPQFIQLSVAMILDEKLVRAIFTPGMVPAANAFIADVMNTVVTTLDYYLYDFEIKVIKQVKNTYKMTKYYPKPTGVTNLTQWKLAYLQNLVKKMEQPSLGKYHLLGKIGDQDPRVTDAKKLVKADFVPVRLTQQLVGYTSPQQLAEFNTLAYSTTFNPENLRLENVTFETLNIDEAQAASGDEIIDTFGSDTYLWAKNIKAAATADDYQTVYLVSPDAFGIMDRFKVTTTSTWINGQYSQTISLFTTYAPFWENIGIKVDLRTA